jgi:hypothetical protein
VYGPVRTVVWEDGGREAPSYPISEFGTSLHTNPARTSSAASNRARMDCLGIEIANLR